MNCLPSNKFYISYKREMYELFWYLTVYGVTYNTENHVHM